MISSLIKQIMEAKGLRQVDLAAVLGVSLDRVKSLTSGRAKNLTGAEMQRLIADLQVRAGFLVSGEPPIFMTDPEITHAQRLENMDQAVALLKDLDLPQTYMIFVRDVVSGALSGQSEQLHKTIDGFVIDAVAEKFGSKLKAALEPSDPTTDGETK